MKTFCGDDFSQSEKSFTSAIGTTEDKFSKAAGVKRDSSRALAN
jgi:hypothetical protein